MKTKCYECKFKGSVPGSAHSSCNVIKQTSDEKAFELEMLLATNQVTLVNELTNEPIVKLNEHGVRMGWASWPIDFDPVWVESCGFFTPQS